MDDYEGGWPVFLQAIENQNDVVAVGVTDYMNVDNYERLMGYRNAGRLSNIALFFPNIEFRITPKTRDGRGINIHLLVSPDDPNHVSEIKNALYRLSIEFNGRKYSCIREQFIALGHAVKQGVISERDALWEGANQFKVEFEAFKKWFDSEGWLRRNSIVVVAASNIDGAAGIQHDDGFKALRTELYRFSDMIFSGNPNDRAYWLGQSHAGEAVNTYGSPKPCIHGSDAHSLERLFRPDQNRFCWIKADPTYEGLKQVIYEPGERVWIGEVPPSLHDKNRTIKAISLSGSNWFGEKTFPLNPGLVAIIGQKGMGKSALNDLIAYSGGSWHDSDNDSFIGRARSHIKGMTINLHWADDRITPQTITAKGASPSNKREVRYLSQKFVERLCADHAATGELAREIEAVIFSYLSPTETLNASNFSDLREKRTAGIVADQRRLQEDLRSLHRRISDLYTRRLSVPDRKAKEAALVKERDGIIAQIPASASDAEAQVAKQLKEEQAALGILIDTISTQKEMVLRLRRLGNDVTAFQTNIDKFWRNITPELKALGISEVEWEKFLPKFPEGWVEIINKRESEIIAAITGLEGAEIDPAPGTIRAHQQMVQQLNAMSTADEAKRLRIAELQSRISMLDTELRRVRAEIETIDGSEKEQLEGLRAERRSVYYEYFGTLDKERLILAELYGPLQEHLSLGEQERHLDFSIRLGVDVEGWVEKGMRLFNQRKRLPYPTLDDMLAAATDYLLPAWTTGNRDELKAGLDKFLEPFKEAGATVGDYLKPSQSVAEFFDWLYSTDHIRLTYGLNYNSTPLENLSPGTKGIVLLILYLAMDRQDTRPLLIDQPEENLDNESIYSLLASYFRKAKLRRQVLLITHNPNLVVNTDAEQVIVAQCVKGHGGLPSFTYVAGALEDCEGHSSIRQQVCRLLEGGAAAFQKREKRYSLSEH